MHSIVTNRAIATAESNCDRVISSNTSTKCKECDGTGIVKRQYSNEKWERCPSCDGRGTVSAIAALNQVLPRQLCYGEAPRSKVAVLLTDRRVYEQKLRGYRYFVDVLSHEWEEQEGHLVPKHSQTLDVVVTEPTEAAIKLLVASCGWLADYQVVAYSKPEDGCEF